MGKDSPAQVLVELLREQNYLRGKQESEKLHLEFERKAEEIHSEHYSNQCSFERFKDIIWKMYHREEWQDDKKHSSMPPRA